MRDLTPDTTDTQTELYFLLQTLSPFLPYREDRAATHREHRDGGGGETRGGDQRRGEGQPAGPRIRHLPPRTARPFPGGTSKNHVLHTPAYTHPLYTCIYTCIAVRASMCTGNNTCLHAPYINTTYHSS